MTPQSTTVQRTPSFALPFALSEGRTCGECRRWQSIGADQPACGRCPFRPGIIGRFVTACALWKGRGRGSGR